MPTSLALRPLGRDDFRGALDADALEVRAVGAPLSLREASVGTRLPLAVTGALAAPTAPPPNHAAMPHHLPPPTLPTPPTLLRHRTSSFRIPEHHNFRVASVTP